MLICIFRSLRFILKLILAIIIVNIVIINLYFINEKSDDFFNQFIKNENLDKIKLYIENDIKNTSKKQNACLFILVRNKELKEWLETMKQFEKNFNTKFNYPYVFMNDVPFTREFKQKVLETTKSKVEFGLVPKEHWSVPKWINYKTLRKKLRTSLRKMWSGTKLSYHHMCRYYSGFFFRENLTLKYDYFWRIEPGVSFPCEIPYDPFQYMVDNNKLYGFSIARPEMMNTIPSLWKKIKIWLDLGYKNKIAQNNAIDFISSDKGQNLDKSACTFFNNFEIGAFSVFRDKQYLDYFDYLDKSGGFFYERWGDSAINTFYLVMMLNKSQLHNFDDFPYFHPPRYYCPKNPFKNCDLSAIDGCKFVNTSEICYNHWQNTIIKKTLI
jgi:alpha 1,2-mannosyltransferase